MLQAMEKMIGRYGSPMVLLRDGEESAVRAFLQETRSKGKSSGEQEWMLLGQVPGGVYVYIGPVSPEIREGNILLWQQKRFEVRRAEVVMVGGEPAYCWGLCVETGGDSVWGS